MVQVARAWDALDRKDPDEALSIASRAAAAVNPSRFVAPLVLIHALSLLMNGRPRSAIEMLRSSGLDHLGTQRSASWHWRQATLGIAASLLRNEAQLQAARRQLEDVPLMLEMLDAYVALVRGGEIANPNPSPVFGENPRYRVFYWVLIAGTRVERGLEAGALSALEHVASIEAIHHISTMAWVLPDETLQKLRDLAEQSGNGDLVSAFPEHSRLHKPPQLVSLTQREQQVLSLLRLGYTNAQIAAELFISPNTAKYHVANLLRSLGVSSREEAASHPPVDSA